MNLVVNARDATLPTGRKQVALSVSSTEIDATLAQQRSIAPGRYVKIEVADAGQGMPPDVIARVFEPYFTTKARGKGTGLGLATVHGIVQQARGDITVESTVGEGTTFRILLPATDQSDETCRIPIAAPNKQIATVLVVDDDDDVRRVTERILRNAGYKVVSSNSGQGALAAARGHGGAIDLLLTDIVMPGLSGRDLARELSGESRVERVIFMSGYHQHAPIAGSQFISKPFTRADLIDKLREVLTEESAVAI